ncbi:hypothetical protein [Bdellovibrio svalbardensis]|uniref:Uncharacterized protein n=1 Tax=Bdellovibrio svalbardensis TaxID=2972972 RepID=A0ABT6DMZ0_9BACT|nr:hypothetical protein [Bdellovibrio svalbardensis]MDG0818246.1 hypothetical protein [Bdellovibrio svalbardensis]
MVKEILELNPGLCKTVCMTMATTAVRSAIILSTAFFLGACFSKEEKTPLAVDSTSAAVESIQSKKKKVEVAPKDKTVASWTRIFAQADGIHREAWWVLTSEKKPAGKSPFGKVERALLSSENIKLANKSIFRCDRYVVKREILAAKGYPQKAEVLEKCSEKQAGKKIADISAAKEGEVQVVFYPENLEEILGLGPSILNKHIECTLQASDSGALSSLKCKNWSEDRTKEQMIRLDTYDYQKEGKNLIKLRGKVYENLSDIRKIEADVPLEGKIEVTETELYAPVEEKPSPTPVPAKPVGKAAAAVAPGSAESGVPATAGAPDTPAVDPDLLRGRMQTAPLNQEPQGVVGPGEMEPANVIPADQGWPVDENGQAITPEMLSPEQQQQMNLSPAPQPQPIPQAPHSEGAPHGR